MDAEIQRILEDIGEQLQELRKAKGYSQDDVMKITGVSRKTQSSLENGSNAKLDTFVKLLRLYGKTNILDNIKDKEPIFNIDEWNKQLFHSEERNKLLNNTGK